MVTSNQSRIEVYENHIVYEDNQSHLEMGFISAVRLSGFEPIEFSYEESQSRRVRIVAGDRSTIVTMSQFE